jgi:hypothetical protein
VSLRVHALDVGIVVLPLGAIGGTLGSACASHTSDHQPGTSAHASPFVAAYRCTGDSTYHRTDNRTAHSGIVCRLIIRRTAHLAVRELPAFALIPTELIKGFPCTR